jgi:long-chain acyl-CoA synthetase
MDALHAFTLGDLLRENRRSRPLHAAAVCGEGRWTYPELDDRVNRLANALLEEGVGSGDRVLWLAQNCHRTLEGLLACAKIGAIFCPANWRGTAPELAFVIEDTDPRVVVWQEEEIGDAVRAAREASGSKALWLRHDAEGAETYEAFIGTAATADPDLDVDPLSPALMLYTAAFGGRPNGALVSHLGFIMECLAIGMLQQVGPDAVYLNSGPLFHIGMFMSTMTTFLVGGTNVFIRRFDPEEFCRIVQEERCTGAYVVGPMMERIIEANRDRRYDLKSLRSYPLSPEWNAMVTVDDSPWVRDAGGYGQTEVTGLLTWRAVGGPGAGSHGRTLPVAQMRVVDADGNDVAPGEVGEIVARGPTAMVAYHNRPDENARRQRGGWHHTHDLGRREPDGSLTFIGPMTTMIKSGVENIYPAEVEAVIQRHPAVQEVCVIGVPDEKWQQSVKAVVVLKPGATATEQEIIEHCRASIASYKKPRFVAFTESLPRNSSGAIDRAAVDEAFGGGNYPGPARTRG